MPATQQQHMTALATANERRLERAALKQQVHDAAGDGPGRGPRGLAKLADVIDHNPASIQSAKVWDVLAWSPRIGPQVIRRVLRHIGASPYRTVGALTERQRTLLVSVLRSPALLEQDAS